jgi:hypothetical protein
MPHTIIVLNHEKPLPLQTRRGKDALRRVANRINGILSGAASGAWSILNDETTHSNAVGVSGRAAAALSLSSGSGSVGATIDGTAITATWATSDANSMALVVNAINSNATVNKIVGATRFVGTLTLASVVAGTTVNVCGITFTATASDTGRRREFSVSGGNNAAALALARAINAEPCLSGKLVAVASGSSAIVYLGLLRNSAPRSYERLSASAGTVTVAQFAASNLGVVYALQPGQLGNACSFTASGTGMTAISQVANKLGGGLGGGYALLTEDTP